MQSTFFDKIHAAKLGGGGGVMPACNRKTGSGEAELPVRMLSEEWSSVRRGAG